ncbi:SusC/RagA family TonB-linked outer membrane protein [Flavobacterium qiangtangense]|uniref:SusC/RagA family TonB-linked outer membrane protein n=1 Tax=Flavobacterium qiangtangense TaxID=1442595 RepID=A0ABW1PNZ8_9FLAO
MRSKFKWIFTLLLAFSMQFSFAQEKTVTGVVSDQTGPLPGASVTVKGTTRGTQTDIDGKYSIKASTGEVLVFTYIGFAAKEATIGASSVINSSLVEGGVDIGEVVVTGALNIRKSQNAITSVQEVVKARELTQAGNPNVLQGLTGKVSGVQINTTNTSVNPTLRIVIGAAKSITGNNQALVVIDGAISSASILSSLPPESIESMNILKGAQGGALYGSDGINGVVIVTTKKGSRSGKMTVNVTTSLDFTEVAYLPERQTRYGQGWDGQHYSYENGAWGPEFNGSLQPTGLPQEDGNYLMLPYSSRGSDNIKDFFKTGMLYQNGVSLSSGDENSHLFFSANNLKNDFIIDGDELKRSSFILRAGKKAGKWTVDGNVTYITSKTKQTDSGLYYSLLQTPTNIPLNLFANGGNEHGYSYYNASPYWTRDNQRAMTNSDVVAAIGRVQYDINKNINVAYNANVNFIQNRSLSYTNDYVDVYQLSDSSIISAFATSNNTSRNFYGDLFLNFDYDLTDDLNLKVNLGNNIQDRLTTQTAVSGTGLSVPGLYNISNVSSAINGSNTYTRTRKYAFFGNLDLSYKNYLFLNVTGRQETVSYLSKDNNSYFYPSAGLSFVATNAIDGLKGDFLSYLKIAAAVVKVGNADVAAYAVNRGYVQATGFPFDGMNSYVPNLDPTVRYNSLTDPNIRPEFYLTKEISASLGFFDNRITIDASYNKAKNTDLITSVSSSYASGNPNLFTNIGETSSENYILDLGFTPIKTEDFVWNLKLSYSRSKTMIEKVTDFSDSVSIYSPYGTYGITATKGEEYPIITGIGYLRDDEGRVIVGADGTPQRTTAPIKLGKTTPDYILGLNTSFDYKGLRLSGTLDYRTGHQYYSGTKYTLAQFGYLTETAENGRNGFIFPNSSVQTAPGVYTENTSVVTGGTSYASYQQYITGQYSTLDENFVLDATAFRVRELALSYALPTKFLDRTGLDSVRFGVQARNPFTTLPKENRGYDDPENSINNGNAVGLASGTSRSGGNGTNQYPNTRSYGFSLNLTF